MKTTCEDCDVGTVAIAPGRMGYSLALPGFSLAGCEARVTVDGGASEPVRWTGLTRRGNTVRLAGRTRSGRWELAFSDVKNTRGVSGVRIEMKGQAAKGARVTGLVPLAIPRLRADHLLLHGRSAGGCHLMKLPVAAEEAIVSHFQQMITRRGVTLQICQPLLQKNPSRMSGKARGSVVNDLAVTTPLADSAIRALRAEPVMLFADRDGHSLMEAWAEAQCEKKEMPAPVAGWNSWDYYRWTITEESVLKNAEFIARDPVLRKHVKRIIIDDGWQYAYGEWDANPLFPHGMKWLAQRLTKMGFEPGLWIAPAIIEPHARIAQWDTDMLARGRTGLPCMAFSCMERFGFVLDPTVPKTQKWLYNLFDRYVKMGYRYFKLDFLKPLLNAPCFADPKVPRGQLVRKLIEPAYRAIHGRGRIMGCGYDFCAGTDLIDEARTSGDIHARWGSICGNVASIATRWWAQGRWWGNDPDFALARGPETSKDPDLERLQACYVFVKPEATERKAHWHYPLATMSLDEARTLLSLVVISGGAVNLSDDLTKLNAVGLDLVRRTVAAERGEAGVALDLFSAQQPAYWVQRLSRGHRVLLINWEDRARTLSLDLEKAGVAANTAIDFWTGKTVRVRQGCLTAELAPHTCLLVEI